MTNAKKLLVGRHIDICASKRWNLINKGIQQSFFSNINSQLVHGTTLQYANSSKWWC